ncbi:hypothetical protein GCM10023196_030790 [Actinoallomurus vinaceus]|uniref:Uncharacterized protein n=1 Tax=Actinoallomurus vinaceus TaxID=1080074 RepID=A0ABP8U9D6_9ACTN
MGFLPVLARGECRDMRGILARLDQTARPPWSVEYRSDRGICAWPRGVPDAAPIRDRPRSGRLGAARSFRVYSVAGGAEVPTLAQRGTGRQ